MAVEYQPPTNPSPLLSALFALFLYLLHSGALSGSSHCSFSLLLTALANPSDSAPFHVHFSKPLHEVTLENSPPPPMTWVSVVSVSCMTIIHFMCLMITYLMEVTKTYQVEGISANTAFHESHSFGDTCWNWEL